MSSQKYSWLSTLSKWVDKKGRKMSIKTLSSLSGKNISGAKIHPSSRLNESSQVKVLMMNFKYVFLNFKWKLVITCKAGSLKQSLLSHEDVWK